MKDIYKLPKIEHTYQVIRKSVRISPKVPPCERRFEYSFDGGKTWYDEKHYVMIKKMIIQEDF